MRAVRLAILMVLACVAGAWASPVHLNVERSYPEQRSLPQFGEVYMQIGYRSDVPVRLQAHAFYRGSPVDAGQAMNASVLHPAGSGSALVWVSFNKPALIDEIRVTAYDDGWRELARLPVAGSFRWRAEPATASVDPPAWVWALIDEENRIARESRQDAPVSAGLAALLYGLFVYLSIPGYLVLQVLALRTQRGGWLLAAMAPALLLVPAAIHALWAQSQGSNLWPLMFLFAAQIGFLYLAALHGLHRLLSGDAFGRAA